MPIYLADDDDDDRKIFGDVLAEIDRNVELVISKNGVELMTTLDRDVPPLPDVLFLDLNMPRKNGFECLKEIKDSVRFKNIPVIIFSTSRNSEYVRKTYNDGATHYICKPSDFEKLKDLIQYVIYTEFDPLLTTPFEKFILE